MASKRYMVVGAGLAGCLVAWELEQAGQEVLLIGSTQLPGASGIAGGILNPVTGRWMTKSWRFDECLVDATKTYQKLEKQFGISIYHPIPFFRYCQNKADVKRIHRRLRNPRYADVLGDYTPPGENQNVLIDTHGSFRIRQASHVNLTLLLQTLRSHFAKQGKFQDRVFTYNDLKKNNSQWHYQELSVNDVIFCEGAGMKSNPWFNWLPLMPVKGEILTFQYTALQIPTAIYHRSKWLFPLDNACFRIGATYNEKDMSETPTQSGKQELLKSIQSFITLPQTPKVIRHTAGLRPCSKDFRPFLGTHPTISGLHIFNGLGSKGTLLAPQMVRLFLDYLLKNKPLDGEFDCARFFK